MKITPEMNGGSLPYGNQKCPACLRNYSSVLALGHAFSDGSYICYAFSPQQKPKNPVATFIFHPDRPNTYTLYEAESAVKLSANTVLNPLDFLFGNELTDKLTEMWQDGYAAW